LPRADTKLSQLHEAVGDAGGDPVEFVGVVSGEEGRFPAIAQADALFRHRELVGLFPMRDMPMSAISRAGSRPTSVASRKAWITKKKP
jgi:hypothetical protein